MAVRLGARQASERDSYKADAEPFQRLLPGYGLRHTFRQLIKLVVHRLSPLQAGIAIICVKYEKSLKGVASH
jgi:hypothetical protein